MPDDILKQEWFILERLHKYPPITLVPPLVRMAREMTALGLHNVVYSVHEYHEGNPVMHFLKDEWHVAAQHSLSVFQEHPELMDRLHEESDTVLVPSVRDISWKLVDGDLSLYSDQELVKLYDEWERIAGRLQFIRAIGWNIETPGTYLSSYLLTYLRTATEKSSTGENPALVFAALMNPTKDSLVGLEHINLLQLAKKVQQGEIPLSPGTSEIQEHARRYAFLPFGCEGPAWMPADIVLHIQEILRAGVVVNIDAQIKEHERQLQYNTARQAEIFDSLPIDESHKHLIQVAKDIGYQKSWSKEHQYLSWYALDKLLHEMARRVHLTIQQMRYVLPEELSQVVINRVCDEDELHRRWAHGLLCFDKGGPYMVTGEKAGRMKAMMNIVDEEEQTQVGIHEFIGQTAVPGKVQGMVKIVNTSAEMGKMKEGDVLVSEMTIPEIVTAMKKAAAIVTDMGGITCHAAIVSRELGIPCVIGTKVATKILKDGDQVEVDATNGVVKKL